METVAPLLPPGVTSADMVDERFDPERINAVRVLRVARGWTQPDLAERINGEGGGKVTKSHVCAWEKGIMSPGPRLIPRVARVLGVDPVRLVYWLSVFNPSA